jgi:uncharacterized protein (DUF2164 family)
MIVLNNDQQDKLVEQFVELQVDSMDMESLLEFVTDTLIFQYGKLSKEELKERIDCYQDDLFEELVDNVTSESYVDSLLTSGTDYPPLVDTEATHDSEGC